MGAVVDTISPMVEGFGKDRAARFEAKQVESNAKAVDAQGLRTATNIRRNTRGILGDMKAAQAVGGGTTTSASSIRQQAKMKDRGDFNALAAIFGAGAQSDGLRNQAKAIRFGGRMARNAGIMSSVSKFAGQGGGSASSSGQALGNSAKMFFGG